MDSLYSKFLGVGYKYKNPIRENYGLSKSTSMPFYSSFQARKLPANFKKDKHILRFLAKMISSNPVNEER